MIRLFFFLLLSINSNAMEIELLEFQMKDGTLYSFPVDSQQNEEIVRFLKLPPSAQERFIQKRKEIIGAAIRSLHGVKVPLGLWQKKIRPQLDWLFGKTTPQETSRLNFRETGILSVREILVELDKHLWRKSEMISNSNEYGVSLELGVSGGGKAGARGAYGIAGLGVVVSVDPIERALALELFGDLELSRRATPFYGGGGIFATMMGSAMATDWQRDLCVEKGEAFCAAGLVGFVSDRYVGLGVSKELGLGFPGVVLLESDLKRLPLFRIGLSPRWPGFVRVKTALKPLVHQAFEGIKGASLKACAFLYSKMN